MEKKSELKKPFTEKARIEFIVKQNHNLGYKIKETATSLEAWDYDSAEQFEQLKQKKISENDRIRDKALSQGVVYNNVLFDSDTDQKINLLATYGTMTDNSTTVWYGKDNQGLLCTKNDLQAIGNLITELHSYCWGNNAYIKEQIKNAKTIEELDSIDISYEMEIENTDLT